MKRIAELECAAMCMFMYIYNAATGSLADKYKYFNVHSQFLYVDRHGPIFYSYNSAVCQMSETSKTN